MTTTATAMSDAHHVHMATTELETVMQVEKGLVDLKQDLERVAHQIIMELPEKIKRLDEIHKKSVLLSKSISNALKSSMENLSYTATSASTSSATHVAPSSSSPSTITTTATSATTSSTLPTLPSTISTPSEMSTILPPTSSPFLPTFVDISNFIQLDISANESTPPNYTFHLPALADPSQSLSLNISAESNTDSNSPLSLARLFAIVKRELSDFLYGMHHLNVWISLSIPKMSDQKGLHVNAKENLFDMILSCERSAWTLCDYLPKYFAQRGKLIIKSLKFPLIKEYQLAILQCDDKQLQTFLAILSDMRNNYAILFDAIKKNWELLQPKKEGTGVEHMY